MKSIFLLAAFAATSLAATCPAGSDPAQLLQSTPWAFQLTAGDGFPYLTTSVGTFRALPAGQLQITETNVLGTIVTRGAQGGGRYILYPDCSGGELLFNVNSQVVQLEFTWANGFNEMYLVTDSAMARVYPATDPTGSVLTGVARRAPAGCPAGLGNPLNILNGVTYSFRTFPSAYWGSSSAGTITASVNASGGVLSGVETIVGANAIFGSYTVVGRRIPIGGRFIINADCSGGELIVTGRPITAGGGGPAQFEFVFSKPDFSEILFLNDAIPSIGESAIAGEGRKLAGTCPADPTTLLQRTPWAFQLTASTDATTGSQSVGTFRALPNGVLQGTLTAEVQGIVSRGAQFSGRYQIYSDCSGGELMFMANSQPMQIEFVFTDSFDEMYLVSDYAAPRNSALSAHTGVAKRAPAACPAGLTNPLNLLSGATWSFRTYGYAGLTVGASSVGSFTPFVLNGGGFLSGFETINAGFNGPVTRLAQISGRYQVYPDCSGGEVMVMNRGTSVDALQLEFVFAGPNFDEMFFLNDSPGLRGNWRVAGQAKKY